MYEPYVILWDNTNPQAITVAFWLFTLSKMYKDYYCVSF